MTTGETCLVILGAMLGLELAAVALAIVVVLAYRAACDVLRQLAGR